jgi:GT2 family glycosyltransferase
VRVESNSRPHPVTVVIPIYGDLPSLKASIASVVEHVDLSVNALMLINDCGPDADAIEADILAQVADVPGVSYFRNPRNLGFGETCNRAVYELDQSENDILLLNSDARLAAGAFEEMTAVLNLDEKHGVVFPRSNNAAIATIPLARVLDDENEVSYDADESWATYLAVKGDLPRYAVTPVAVGFCFLVRRQLIANYGLFDPIYSPGYSEENDFCLRVNKFGYSSIMANHAFVFHEGSMSFPDEGRAELQRRNEELMVSRYTFFRDAVVHYLQYSVDPIDWFADRIHPIGRRKILIDLYHMSLIYNGSTRNALTFLDLLAEKAKVTDIEFVIVSSREAIDFFHLESYGLRVVPNGKLNETFDLGFALSPISDATQINVLNRSSARWVVSHFDVIALRINSLLEVSFTRRQVVLDSLLYANRVLPISEAALDDIESYFGPAARSIRAHSTVIHEGVADISFESKDDHDVLKTLSVEQRAAISRGGYVLVIGNIFTHKQLPETLAALRGFDGPVLALGALAAPDLVADALLIEGGLLSDADIDLLYRNASCVVFPSNYEGFGLPIAEAGQRGIPLVLFDTKVAREVVDSLGIADLVTFFSHFSELQAAVAVAAAIPTVTREVPRALRPLELYNEGIFEVLMDELERPIDLDVLRTRVDHFRGIEIYADVLERRISVIYADRAFQLFRRALPLIERMKPLARAARRARRSIRKRS